MNVFKKSFEEYKKNFFTLAFAQLALFFSSLFFLIYVKDKLTEYLIKIQEFQPQLQQVLNTVDVNDPATIDSSLTVIQALNQVSNEATLFAYILAPLILLVIWSLFQGLFWKTIKKCKIKNNLKYFINLAVPSALVVFLISQLAFPREITDFFNTFDDSILKILIFAFFGFYLLTIYYAVLDNQKLHEALNKTFKIAIKRVYKYLPIYLPLYLNTLVLVWLIAIALTQQHIGENSFIKSIPLVIFIIIALNISKFYKILLQNLVSKE